MARSYVAVIDVTTKQLVDVDPVAPGVQAIALQEQIRSRDANRTDESGLLLVPEAGEYGVMNDGGIEQVDLRTNRASVSRSAARPCESDMIDFAQGLGARGYVASLRCLVQHQPDALRLDQRHAGKRALRPRWLRAERLPRVQRQALPDRLRLLRPGVRIFDLGTEAPLCGGVVPTGLPPFELLVRPDSPSSVEDAALLSGEPWPNPSRDEVHLALTVGRALAPESEAVVLRVVAPDGRLVRRLTPEGGGGEVVWDGRDGASHPVSSGVYLLEAVDPHGRRESRTVRILR
ncbi:MAG: hypothetical protein U0527_12700 [Candidatus Eisenbacteria bacterium]